MSTIEIQAQIESLSSGSTNPSVPDEPETTAPAEPAAVTYEVIEMKYGDCLFAAGAVDIMLRAGSAVCIAPDAGQGISDDTACAEIYNGEALTKNHMCLIPRGDGRGIMATAQSLYIMVRGDYSLVKS